MDFSCLQQKIEMSCISLFEHALQMLIVTYSLLTKYPSNYIHMVYHLKEVIKYQIKNNNLQILLCRHKSYWSVLAVLAHRNSLGSTFVIRLEVEKQHLAVKVHSSINKQATFKQLQSCVINTATC